MSDRRYERRRAQLSEARRSRPTAYGPISSPRPDRVAAWAVVLGIFLVVVASATSHGFTGGALDPSAPGGRVSGGATAPGLPSGGDESFGDRPPLRALARRTATWYGPGFYGRRTACGVRLGRATLGVAHRSLPCGTQVTFYLHGRAATVPVIDRGPYARGISWDLTAAAARRLGLSRTGPVRSTHELRPAASGR